MEKPLSLILQRLIGVNHQWILHSQAAENAIRPFAVGRKNWLFSDSVEGANASAVVYTMVEMAKANDLNVFHYLYMLPFI